jgi:hypothetical protein
MTRREIAAKWAVAFNPRFADKRVDYVELLLEKAELEGVDDRRAPGYLKGRGTR